MGKTLPPRSRYPENTTTEDFHSPTIPPMLASHPLMANESTPGNAAENLFWERNIAPLHAMSLVVDDENTGSRNYYGKDQVRDEGRSDDDDVTNYDDLCGCHFLIKKTSKLLTKSSYILSYGLVSSIISTFLPLIILSACNVCLIRALRHSCRMQALYRANKPKANSGHRITATLIALIVLFIVFVTPADLIVFARLAADVRRFRSYELLTHLANLFLLTNFSLNFILYCVVNAQFRSTLRYLVTCGLRCCSSGKMEGANRARSPSADKMRVTEISMIDRQKMNTKSNKSKYVLKSVSNSFVSSVPSVPMMTMASEACTVSDMEL